MTTNDAGMRSLLEVFPTFDYEVRTLLTDIVGAVESLRDTSLTGRQGALADDVESATNNISHLATTAIEYALLRDGRFAFSRSDFDLLAMVESVTDEFSASAKTPGLSLMTFVSPDLPLRIHADETRLRQMLKWLLARTAGFAAMGDAVLSVSPCGHDADGICVRFEVEQSVDDKTTDDLASPFAVAEVLRSADDIRAVTSREMVRLMGGEFGHDARANGQVRSWFTVTVRAPAVAESRTATKSVAASYAPAKPNPNADDENFLLGTRVLVVDDSAPNREVIFMSLRAWGLDVTRADCVPSATDALHALEEAARRGRPYNVAIIDYVMPHMDGMQLGRAIRASSNYRDTAMILLTAYGETGVREVARQAGFAAFIEKPFRQSELLDALATAVFEEQATPSPAASAAPSAHHAPPTSLILVVEDNVANQKVASAQLERLGYALRAVSNGAEALKELRQHPDRYTLALMDCQMPHMDGFAATMAIREDERKTGRHLPIIAMTASVTRGAREQCIASGMDDYLAKPVSREALRQAILRWIGG